MEELRPTDFWPNANPPVILAGPTATGKTAAALALAERINGEIINADSMQVYRGMDIGTAKPGPDETAHIPFHLLDVVTPDTPFTVADWKQRAESALADITARGRCAIICGGTGLYIRALLDNWTLAETPRDEAVRAKLMQQAATDGAPALHARLAAIDPDTAARLHPNDAVRTIRALEVYTLTGVPISVYQAQDRARHAPRIAHRFALDLPRPALYERIERRVDSMIAAGLEVEVRGLLAQGCAPELGPMRSLGYKEMTAYVSGELSLPDAVEQIKHNTRRFAKRQQTWFRADPLLTWLDVETLDSATVAASLQQSLLRADPTAIR